MILPVLDPKDSLFLARLRSLAIIIIVFGHTGGFWLLGPLGEAMILVVPIFFFISGAVAFFNHERDVNSINFLKKRVVSLLVPYYLTCLLALLVHILTTCTVPRFNWDSFYLWLTLSPSDAISPFNLGQVWYLRCLIVFSLVSPPLFKRHDNIKLMILVISLPVILSFAQLFHDIGSWLGTIDHRAYITIIFLSFYVGGMVIFTRYKNPAKPVLVTTISICILIMIGLIWTGLSPSLSKHSYYPDLYYVSAGIAGIAVTLFLKSSLVKVSELPIIDPILRFSFKHTFSLFLLHSLAIFLSEKIFLLLDFSKATGFLLFGTVKVVLVFILSALMAVPFTVISKLTSQTILSLLQKDKRFG